MRSQSLNLGDVKEILHDLRMLEGLMLDLGQSVKIKLVAILFLGASGYNQPERSRFRNQPRGDLCDEGIPKPSQACPCRPTPGLQPQPVGSAATS